MVYLHRTTPSHDLASSSCISQYGQSSADTTGPYRSRLCDKEQQGRLHCCVWASETHWRPWCRYSCQYDSLIHETRLSSVRLCVDTKFQGVGLVATSEHAYKLLTFHAVFITDHSAAHFADTPLGSFARSGDTAKDTADTRVSPDEL
jgi:hypothetical protein